jgi:sugar lactone lactonase YvrE
MKYSWWFTVLSVCFTAVSLFNASQASATDAPHVSFVVGQRTVAEGGSWSPDQSPLLRPFGVAFTQTPLITPEQTLPEHTMWIVELEGGRVFNWKDRQLSDRVSGDGSRSYKGDGLHFRDATYNGMHNCAIDSSGNLYISDTWNHCVRMVNLKSGIITTIAGTGSPGYSGDGGPATKATFDYVMCVTLDPAEQNLLITDLNNHRIRSLNLKSGVVQTVAGNGQQGIPADGVAAIQSPLSDPRAAAADAAGNLYILERGGHALRMVSPDGRIQTVAGTGSAGFKDGPALTAQLNSPKHLCMSDSGQVIIADDENEAIRAYDPDAKTLTTILGRGFGDPKIRLAHPHGVCWHNNALFVVDSSNNRILKLSN